MSNAAPLTCRVLASRSVLDRLDEPIDLALEALEMTRLPLRGYEDQMNLRARADVTLAEVSKPSPTAAFELGLIAAQGDPAVYLVKAGSRPPVVFEDVGALVYDADESAARLGYRLAGAIEAQLAAHAPNAALGDRLLHSGRTKPNSRELIRRLNERQPPHSRVRAHSPASLEGVIVHTDRSKGFALVATPQNRPAMLHVSNMPSAIEAAFRNGELTEGRVLRASVADTDPERGSTQLRDPDVLVDVNDVDPDVRDLSTMILAADLVAAAASSASEEALEFFNRELNDVRVMRNKLAHGEPIGSDEVRTSISDAVRLLTMLNAGGPGPQGQSN